MANQNTQLQAYSDEELQTIQQTIAKGTTPQQFQLFIKTAQHAGLNPFLNHLHCIVYDGKGGPQMSIQIAVEGIQYLARRSEGYKGIDTQLVHENDEFSYDSETKEIKHRVSFPRGKVIGAYSIARREGFDDVVVLMETDEVEHMKKGRNGHMWRDWFNDMFKKHVTKRAAKLQYGIEIAEDETESTVNVNIPEYQSAERRDITNEAQHTDKEPGPDPKQEKQQNEPEPPQDDEATKLKRARAEMSKKFKKLGITDKEAMGEYIAKHAKVKDGKKPTLAEITGLLKIMDAQIAEKQAADDDILVPPPPEEG